MPIPRQDLTGTTLVVLFIASLIAATLWIMRPFLPAIVWAVTLVIATWPLMLRVQRYAGNRRGLAVLIMTVVLLLVLLIPLWLAVDTIIGHADRIGIWVRTILSMRVPEPPAWLDAIPVIGDRLSEAWSEFAYVGVQDLAPKLTPYAGAITNWFIATAGSLGLTLLQFLLTIGIAAAFYAGGERAAQIAIRFGRRLGGDPGEMAVRLAGQAIRSVALGVVVTALAQSLLGGIGLAISGIPFAPVLTAVLFMLCLAQIGPALVMIPATVWLYYATEPLWGTILLVFTLVTITMDNFMRPILIKRGAHLPLSLVLAGVIGGIIAMGLLGIFLGPTILAIAYTLLNAWMDETEEPTLAAQPVPNQLP